MNTTKSKLISSLLILTLCVTMFVGSTYAWFTDSAVSAGNKIQAGTLDVALEVLNKTSGDWEPVEDDEPLFNYSLWEPGYTEATVLKVKNEGSLALKWNANLVSYVPINEKLAKVIDVYVQMRIQHVKKWLPGTEKELCMTSLTI